MVKKKILFVIPYLHCGGAERVVGNITSNITDEYDIDILVNSTKEVEYEYGGNLISLGVDKVKKVNSPFFQFVVLIKRTLVLMKLKKNNNYSACISNLDSAHISNILSGNKHCKTILVAHSAMSEASTDWKYRLFIVPAVKMLYRSANTIVAVSAGIKNDFVKNYHLNEEKIAIIYNGVDTEDIERLKDEPLDAETKKFINGKKVFCNVGRLDYPKAQWHLIRAFNNALKESKEMALLIVGEGDFRLYLENLIKNLGLSMNVRLVGYQNNPYKYLNHSDVFVFPSMFEGFPNAPIEALELGLPVIATDFHFGAREILAPEMDVDGLRIDNEIKCKYGYLTPVCDGRRYSEIDALTDEEEILARAMLDVIRDETVSKNNSVFSDMAKERAGEFSLGNMIKEWKRLLEVQA